MYKTVPDPVISEDFIYQIRLAISKKKQSLFKTAINELNQKVLDKRAFNPFSYDRDLYNQLLSVSCFIKAEDKWRNLDLNVNLQNSLFLYRIDSLESLSWNHENKFNEESGFGLMTGTAKRRFQYFDNIITDKDHQQGNWLPLSRILTSYNPRRNITWWTDRLIDHGSLDRALDTVYRLGIPNNWLREYSIIMRCDLGKLKGSGNGKRVWVPSVVDAFCSPIFNPMDERKGPNHGLGINLKDVTKPGYPEYVLRDLSLDAITFRVIEIKSFEKEQHGYAWLSKELYGQIIDFHLLNR